MKKIVILGGGFGGVEFYKYAHKQLHGSPDVAFHLVSRWNYFLFYPMLHEVAMGSVERSHITQPIREVMNCCLESFTQAEITRVDVQNRKVITDSGEIEYDYLVVALGSEPNYFNTPGAEEYCISFKSITDAVVLRNKVIGQCERASHETDDKKRKELLSFVIIGGGPAGVELAGQLADLLHDEIFELYPEIRASDVTITLVDAGDRLLHMFHPETSRHAELRLRDMGVTVRLRTRVTRCESHAVWFDDGSSVTGDVRVWVGGNKSTVRGKFDDELLTERGGIKTDVRLQMVDHPEVFVIGDAMEQVGDGAQRIPQTAQSATASARHASQNLVALIRHEPLRPFYFESAGDIVPIGDGFAVAEIGHLRFFGKIAWIMRRFVFLIRLNGAINRLKVTVDWVLQLFSRRDTSQL